MEHTNIDSFQEIDTYKIDPPAHMIRLSIDPAMVRELANDIKSNGLLQPIVVTKKGERYEIIAGHRRFLAINSLGWPRITCKIKDISPENVAICRAAENLSRVDMTPIEEALTYKDLLDSFGMSYEQIADKLGKSPGTVKRRTDLLNMPEEMRNALHANRISVGVAESLISITDRTALSYYLECAIDNGITVTVARQWANDWKMAQLHQQADIKPGDSIPSVFYNKITYITCDTCGGPEDINLVKMLRCCKICMNSIISNLKKIHNN